MLNEMINEMIYTQTYYNKVIYNGGDWNFRQIDIMTLMPS